MTKQEKTALNMARFIRSQTLTLLEKLNELGDGRIPAVKQSKSGTRYNHTTQMTDRTEKTKR